MTGFDFFRHTPWMGDRLTGSFSTYRVGNLMALLFSPSLTLPFLLPHDWSPLKRWGLALFFWLPCLFLIIFSKTRTGFICVAVSSLVMTGMMWKYSSKKAPIFILCGLCIVIFWMQKYGIGHVVQAGSQRLGVETVMGDGRLQELWPFAWRIFKEYPIFGCGLYGYNPSFTALGMAPLRHSAGIMHPHNIYLQLLAETGIIGFLLFLFFVLSAIVWSGRHIYAGLKSGKNRTYWMASTGFWAVMIGYLGMGITGHDVLRSWWLGMVMAIYGIAIGACLLREQNKNN